MPSSMYLAINLPHHIAIFGGVLLLTASHMISQLFKCTGSPPRLLMHLHGPLLATSCSLNLSICFNRYLLETSTSYVCPDPSYCRDIQSHPWRHASRHALPASSIYGWFNHARGRRKGGKSNIGNFRNKNKHNILPMIIPMPPFSIAFSATSESFNLSSSSDPLRLHHYHHNTMVASPPPQPKPPHPKFDTKAAAVL